MRFGSCLCKICYLKPMCCRNEQDLFAFLCFLFSLFCPFILHHLKQPSLHTSSFSGPCHPSSPAPWLLGSEPDWATKQPISGGAWMLQGCVVQFSLSSPCLLQLAKPIHFSCPKYIICADISPPLPVQCTLSQDWFEKGQLMNELVLQVCFELS